jgi:hypothetical protein
MSRGRASFNFRKNMSTKRAHTSNKNINGDFNNEHETQVEHNELEDTSFKRDNFNTNDFSPNFSSSKAKINFSD